MSLKIALQPIRVDELRSRPWRMVLEGQASLFPVSWRLWASLSPHVQNGMVQDRNCQGARAPGRNHCVSQAGASVEGGRDTYWSLLYRESMQ
eukprot:1088612-Rhodomonas_salina.7